MPLAGIGSRFIAIVVDYLIWTVAFVILVFLAVLILASLQVFDSITPNWAVGIVLLLIFLLHWGYFTLFEAFGNGRTPGKRVAKIRVIHCSGRAISFVEALARNLVRAVDYLPGFYAVGVVAMFLSRQHQRLGDMVAGTLVVRDREIASPHWGEMGTRTITAPAFAPVAPLAVHPVSYLAAPHLSVTLSATALGKLSTTDLEVLEGFFAAVWIWRWERGSPWRRAWPQLSRPSPAWRFPPESVMRPFSKRSRISSVDWLE